MTTDSGSRHADHLFKIGELAARRDRWPHERVNDEADQELLRYRDEGLIIQKEKDMGIPMTMSGHCQFESPGSHAMCYSKTCTCECHKEPKAFQGKGILFAVIDDREKMRTGKVTTIDVIADAIEAALDAGKETSEEIARYLTTSAFQHIADKRVRFNSVLKAGDTVGAQIVRKLYNSYNELSEMADDEKSPAKKATLRAEAQGFAEAISVVMTPFSVEDDEDPQMVNWEEVDRLTATFEKEQAENRRIRKMRR